MGKEASKRYRFLGNSPTGLASGRPVEPGEFLALTTSEQTEPHNAEMIERGVLVEAPEKEGGS
jgi:hypothetical protein